VLLLVILFLNYYLPENEGYSPNDKELLDYKVVKEVASLNNNLLYYYKYVDINPLVKNIKIGIIDVGFSNNNPNIETISLNKENLLNEKSGNLHGDMVAEIIVSKRNVDRDFVGVLPGVTVFTYNLSPNKLNTEGLKEAFEVMSENHMDIINVSLATAYDDPALKTVIDKVVKEGMVIVAAAGNYQDGRNYFPAAYNTPGVISVGAVSTTQQTLDRTAYNTNIDIWAVGENVYPSTSNDIISSEYRGTSIATPIITSLVALIMTECNKEKLSPSVIERMIISNSSPYKSHWKGRSINLRIVDFKKTIGECEG